MTWKANPQVNFLLYEYDINIKHQQCICSKQKTYNTRWKVNNGSFPSTLQASSVVLAIAEVSTPFHSKTAKEKMTTTLQLWLSCILI
jgi:hypothetical protein